MLGVLLHQFTHWWQYARTSDARTVRYIVVSHHLGSGPSITIGADQAVLLHDLQYRYISLVSSYG
jgi:hypothetical protein